MNFRKNNRNLGLILALVSLLFLFFQNCGKPYDTVQGSVGASSTEASNDGTTPEGTPPADPTSPMPPNPPTAPTVPTPTPGGGLICTMPNQHLENGMCVSNTRNCTILNGTGMQTWSGSSWGMCQLVTCNTGYVVNENLCQQRPPGIQTVETGARHTCAIDSMNRLWCLGLNNSGQLGTGNSNHQPRMVQVTALTSVKEVSCGSDSTCAIDNNDDLWCWGSNHSGKLGINSTAASSLTPQRIASSQKFKKVSVGNHHVCAIDSMNQPWCWGNNSTGTLGNGSTTNSSLPTRVVGLTQVKQIIATENPSPDLSTPHRTCATDMNSQLWCWGSNGNSQIRAGTQNVLLPFQMTGIPPVEKIEIDIFSSAYVDVNGVFQIRDDYLKRVSLQNVNPAPTKIAVGYDHFCYLNTENKAFCKGVNNRGQVGTSFTTTQYVTNWFQIPNLNFRFITADHFRTCGIDTSGALYCWGWEPLGDGTFESSFTPIRTMEPL